jgi:type I restriction enzyme S subunit
LGVARVVPKDLPEFSIFVSVALLCPKQGVVQPWLIAEFFETAWFFRQIGYLSAGTGLKHIHLEHFREFLLPVPPLEEQSRMKSIVTSLDALLEVEKSKLQKLSNLKLGLTSDLLIGRVRVPVTLELAEAPS